MFIATGAGTGRLKGIAGMAGTVLGIPIFLLSSLLPLPALLLFLAALTVLGGYVAHEAQRVYPQSDPPQIVIDEIVGLQWTLLLLPPTAGAVFSGFLFFRFFDTFKPFPINWLDRRLTGGLGIVVDDLAAAVYARICLEITGYFTGWW